MLAFGSCPSGADAQMEVESASQTHVQTSHAEFQPHCHRQKVCDLFVHFVAIQPDWEVPGFPVEPF
jgi:hypothetical protein